MILSRRFSEHFEEHVKENVEEQEEHVQKYIEEHLKLLAVQTNNITSKFYYYTSWLWPGLPAADAVSTCLKCPCPV